MEKDLPEMHRRGTKEQREHLNDQKTESRAVKQRKIPYGAENSCWRVNLKEILKSLIYGVQALLKGKSLSHPENIWSQW